MIKKTKQKKKQSTTAAAASGRIPARRRCWSSERWAQPSSPAGSCCCRCWPAGKGEGGGPSETGSSPSSGGRTLETPQRELIGRRREKNFTHGLVHLQASTSIYYRLTHICVSVVFNYFSQFKMTGHNCNLKKTKPV